MLKSRHEAFFGHLLFSIDTATNIFSMPMIGGGKGSNKFPEDKSGEPLTFGVKEFLMIPSKKLMFHC